MELRLDKLGHRVSTDRRDDQTASAYAASLARAWSDDRLERVGEVIDRSLYAPAGASDGERAFVRMTLEDLERGPAPEPPADVGITPVPRGRGGTAGP